MIRAMVGLLALCTLAALASCGDSEPSEPEPDPDIDIAFEPAELVLGEERSASVAIRNHGTSAVGPIELVPAGVTDAGGSAVPGPRLSVRPGALSSLGPGELISLTVTLDVPPEVAEGEYRATLHALVDGAPEGALSTFFSVPRFAGPAVASLEITGGAAGARQGEVLAFDVTATDDQGAPVPGALVGWRVDPSTAGFVTDRGRFVAYAMGTVRVIATGGGAADTAAVEVTARGVPAGAFDIAGNGRVESRYTSDHWEYGDAAYTGTWGCRNVLNGACGDVLFVWDITVRQAPVLVDSVIVDARTVNDVKVSEDGSLAILTHERSGDGLNGITLLDLADPHHPTVITRFTPPELNPGVHNVWIEGSYAYVVPDGPIPGAALQVVNVSDPAVPLIVASFPAPGRLHDVYVRDGLAFLSNFEGGLVILDVGNGIAGGTPEQPAEVSRIAPPDYLVHNAWYWPEAGYVFLGDEIHAPGRVMVIDVADLASPREVATYAVEGATPHNFWVDEAAGIAYFAWYENGLHAVDVTGELLGDLERQARKVAGILYDVGGACFAPSGTCTWAPQLHDGLVYVSDVNSGLWALRPVF